MFSPARRAANRRRHGDSRQPASAERTSQLEAYMRYAEMSRTRQGSLGPLKPGWFADRDAHPHSRPDPFAEIPDFSDERYPDRERDYVSDLNGDDWIRDAPRRDPPDLRYILFGGIAALVIGALGAILVFDRTSGHRMAAEDATAGQSGNKAERGDGQNGREAGTRKPIAMAKLEVADASGRENVPIALQIRAQPVLPEQKVAVRVSGLPAGAHLSAGTRLGDNSWVLKDGEHNGLKLLVPNAPASVLVLEVDVLDPNTGDLAAPSQEIRVVLDDSEVPVAAGDPQIEPASTDSPEVRRNFNLLSSGAKGR